MSIVSTVSRRSPATRTRPLKLAALALACAGALGLTACQQRDGGFSRGDAELALQTLKAAPQHGFSPDQFDAPRIERLLASDEAKGDQALRAALVAYARAQHGQTI